MNDDPILHSFLLIRHGETTANADKVASGGDADPSLTENGRQQIREAANILRRIGEVPDFIICSANHRSIESAEILQEYFEAPIESDPLFNERSLGEWNNVSLDIVNPMLVAGETPKDGESRAEFKKRFWRAMNEHKESILNNQAIIVGSRGTARILLELADDRNAAYFPNGNLLKISIAISSRFEVVDIDYLN